MIRRIESTLNSPFSRFCPTILALCIAGCAGQITTDTGVQGLAIAANAPVTVVASPDAKEAASSLAQAAVAQALVKHGHAISTEARVHVEVALAERSAQIAVTNVAGDQISPSHKRGFMQSCAYRIQRLTIAVYDDGQPGVTRAWAEERHCKAGLKESISALAERAVALLDEPALAGKTQRTGKN